uniref:Poly(A)-specific ribonuclease RNA-binding domain-containing protein n=1 Tax=Clastoptera arizonana TaxID=38151 RepID=A0A1B6DFL6_9HEMI
MDVTCYNFKDILTELETDLKNSSFVSIDSEFTGLNYGESTNPLDSPDEYYTKIRTGAQDFLLIQFGLAVFKYNESIKKFTHKAYNFYVFPKPSLRGAPDCRFICQASSIDFLIKNNFNFNKLFLEGIPYLNQNDEQKMRDKLNEKRMRNSLTRTPTCEMASIAVPEEHVKTINDACEKISDFLKNKTLEEITLDSCNGFVRKLIYQEAWKKFSRDELTLETRQYQIVAKRLGTPEEREKLEKDKMDQENTEITDAVGFSKVIRLLSETDTLIVGHNMFLDLCHILHRFCMPLPEKYKDFKQMLHCLFPKVLDTKLMCSSPEFKELIPSTVLSHVMSKINEAPFQLVNVEPEDSNYGYNTSEEKAHEAGYDAYITGVAFLSLAHYLGSISTPKVNPVLPNSPIVQKYINKLYLMKILDTYMNLNGNDPAVKRDNVFHLTFPKEWVYQDINTLFSPYGNIYVTWLTDTSAFVTLSSRDNVLAVTRNLVRAKKVKHGVKVITFNAYHNSRTKSPINDVLNKPSPSIQEAKKRKSHEPQSSTQKKSRVPNFDLRETSSPHNISSIPEETETVSDFGGLLYAFTSFLIGIMIVTLIYKFYRIGC